MFQAIVSCPVCSCPVSIKKYGYGWIGLCCGKIFYNSAMPPLYISTNANLNLMGNIEQSSERRNYHDSSHMLWMRRWSLKPCMEVSDVFVPYLSWWYDPSSQCKDSDHREDIQAIQASEAYFICAYNWKHSRDEHRRQWVVALCSIWWILLSIQKRPLPSQKL